MFLPVFMRNDPNIHTRCKAALQSGLLFKYAFCVFSLEKQKKLTKSVCTCLIRLDSADCDVDLAHIVFVTYLHAVSLVWQKF